jgi:5,10-methylene-tetrahydrofolate dehydrogenase/methenyl tetrahydrofolate cyclohydrolase
MQAQRHPWHKNARLVDKSTALCTPAAIIEASRDEMALVYGAFFWLIGRLLIYGIPMFPILRAALKGFTVSWLRIGETLVISMVIDAILFVVRYGIAHSLARWWLGARGTYIAILRAMLMGSIAIWVYAVPYVGPVAAGFWMIAILMRCI